MAVHQKAIVKSVLSGDTIILRQKQEGNKPPPEKQLSLAFVQAPRLGNQKVKTDDESFAFESREYLRLLIVGKEVSFVVSFSASGREYGTVYLEDENVTRLAVKNGWLAVRKDGRKDDVMSEELRTLFALEQEAQEAKFGIWGEKVQQTTNHTMPSGEDATKFFTKYKNAQIDAIVEQVRHGHSLHVLLLLPSPEPRQRISFQISGIRTQDLTEPFGEEAKFFVESRLLQRNVKVIIEGLSQNNQAFIGSVLHPQGNIAEALVFVGLANVVDWGITMVTGGPVKLREAERAAKEKRLRIWQNHVARSKAGGDDHEFDGTVIRIISGDTIQVRINRAGGVEKKLQLSSIRQPKPKDPKLPEYNWEAKEFLRKKLIGKTAHVIIDYVKPAQDGYEMRECATVKIGELNIGEVLVECGLAQVIRHKKDDPDRSSSYDQLLIAEKKAVDNAKGVHSGKEPPVYRISDASETVARARQFLGSFQRAGRISGIVDHVMNGSRFKIYIPKESCKLTLVLGGVRVPKLGRSPSEKSEAFATEALEFAVRKTLQRDVEIEVENTDKTGGFIGTLWLSRDNFAVSLLQEGLATVHEYSANQNPYTNQLFSAERSAKSDRKNIWLNYDPQAAPSAAENGVDQSLEGEKEPRKNYIDVMITEFISGGHFYVQIVNENIRLLERMMSEFSLYHKTASDQPITPKSGELVSAQFTEDNQWYRAKVKKVTSGNQTVDVMYTDYGNSETIPLSRVRPIPQNFLQLPPQSHEAVLSFLKVPTCDEDYGEEACDRLKELTAGKQLVANVDFVEHNVRYLTLFDPAKSRSPEESVNAELIRDGLALVDKKSPYGRRPVNLSALNALNEAQQQAKKNRLGMFEYGDITADDDDDRY